MIIKNPFPSHGKGLGKVRLFCGKAEKMEVCLKKIIKTAKMKLPLHEFLFVKATAPSVYKIKKILKKALTKVKSCCRIAIVVKTCAFSSAG